KLSNKQLGASARILSIVVRWVELLKATSATTAPLDAIASAAVTLWKETLAGSFDAAIVKDLLAAIRPELPAAVQSAVLQGPRLKLDRGHSRLAGPHVQMARETPKGRPTVSAAVVSRHEEQTAAVLPVEEKRPVAASATVTPPADENWRANADN